METTDNYRFPPNIIWWWVH